MKLWSVSVDRSSQQLIQWGQCTIKLRHSAAGAADRYVVETDDRAIEAIHRQSGVLSAERADDGIYYDDSGLVFELSRGGKRWLLLDGVPGPHP